MEKVWLDTQSFLWWVGAEKPLPRRARAVLESDDAIIMLSHVSVWEMAIKAGSGKLTLPAPAFQFAIEHCKINRFQLQPISLAAIGRVEALPKHHGDPFDRLLAAECLISDLPIITSDAIFSKYRVRRIWQ